MGYITTSAYDFLDRPVSTHFPDPAHSSDSVKYSVSSAATVGLTTLFSFPEDIVFIKECLDENGHVVREVTDVRGKLRLRQSYDSTNAIVTYFDYDDLGNLTRVIKPNGDEVRYKYNSFGQLIEEEAADLLDSSGTGNYGRITYEYDKNGNLIRKQDATLRAGSSSYTEKIYYDYDALDRITASGLEASQGSQSFKTPVSRYFYDQQASELSVGRLSLVFTSDLSSRSNYAERYHYDGRGRVKRQVNYFQAVLDSTYVTGTGWVYSCHGDSVVLRYTYDWADQLRSITYADGSIVRYDYDERGRLTKVGGAEPGEVDRYARLTHTRRDELESMEIGGAIQHLDYAYNERGWLQSINDGVSGGAAPDDLFGQRLYYYDHPYSQMPWPAQYNGNVFCQKLSIAGDEKRFAHRYDKSDRLRESLLEAFEFESFNYDGNGNITFASKFTTSGTVAKDFHYEAGTNRLAVADRQHWLVDDTLTYDHNGNVIRHSGKNARFYYDALNRFARTEIQGSWGIDTVWYGYSAGGERIYKEYFYHFRRECSDERSGEEGSRGPGEGDSTSLWCTDTARTFTYYVLGQGKVLAEQTSPAPSGAARRFIYAGGTRIAMRDASGKLHYYLSDHLGSTRVVIDSTGLLEDRYWYHSFGTLVSEQTSTNQAYRYTSKPLDKEGGLDIYYYGARYYDPELGRFLALDPAAGEYPSLSPYAYCANNPLGLVDTDGNNFLDVIQGAIRAFADNLSLGLADKRSDYTPENPSHYSLGQDLGDVASVAVGGLESLSGAEAVVVGVAGTAGSGGTAAAVGVPVAGAGVVVAGHGAGMAAGGLANLFSRGGRLGGQDHRSAVKDEAARLEGEGHKIDAGGGGSEKRVNTPSGKKEHRFPDIQSRDPSGNVVYTNVGRTAKNGSPVPRENEALQDLQRTGQTTRFVPMEE